MYNYLHKDNVGRVDIGVCHNCILGHIARKATECVTDGYSAGDGLTDL